jgi:hypothetical protein
MRNLLANPCWGRVNSPLTGRAWRINGSLGFRVMAVCEQNREYRRGM